MYFKDNSTKKCMYNIDLLISMELRFFKVNNMLWSNFVSGIHVHDLQTCFLLNLKLK